MAPTLQQRETAAVAHVFDSVGRETDTALAAKELIGRIKNEAGFAPPKVMDRVLSRVGGPLEEKFIQKTLDGIAHYEREHGIKPPAELVEVALHNAYTATLSPKELGITGVFDSATNEHHDQHSLHPERAITGSLSTYVEAVPFAAYLPTDTGSNEARLALITHKADSDFGEYAKGSSLDGVNAGGMYLDSERIVELTANGGAGPFTATVTAQFTGYTPKAASGTNPALPLLRGRTQIIVNGLLAAAEIQTSSGEGNNSVAGAATIANTTYQIGGTVNSDTGAISITTNAELPANTKVHALVYIDYEREPKYTPKVGMKAEVFKLFARATRGLMQASIDSVTQIQNELSVDPRSEALLALRAQYALERHYRLIQKLKFVAANMPENFNFDHAGQKEQKTRAQIWTDFSSVLGNVSQKMANATNDHGITTLYVTGFLASQLHGLPRDIWEPSGIEDRPGIYRMGRLFGRYDVYYTPKGLKETNGGADSEVLCVGRSNTVARNPVVMGDAVPAMFLPLATNSDLVHGQAFYARSFTEINPHAQSAQGAALISVTGMK